MTADDFSLEPSPPHGEVPEAVISELMEVRQTAKDYAQSYADAVGVQADKFGCNKGALKRFIAARQDDKLKELDEEMTDLARLLER
jgi:hypothetical protein